ncbi:hypothetical protein Drorol1_Dr00011131 [Drosera rotundifolia]
MRPIPSSLSTLLRTHISSTSSSAINIVKQTHAITFINSLDSNITLLTDILLAYARCSVVGDARKVFDRMPERSMHSWNILISAYVQREMYEDGLGMFGEMVEAGVRPDHYTLPSAMKASAGAGWFWLGKCVHCWVVRFGFEGYVVVGGAIMDFYFRVGEVMDARRVFDGLPWRDVVAWNAMISGLGRGGCFVEALEFFRAMLGEGVRMDSLVIPSVVNACGGEGDLIKGKEVHGQVIKIATFESDVAIGNAFIGMYSRSGCLYGAENVFKNMRELNLLTWTTMISCYGHHGKGDEALVLFDTMLGHGFKPNHVTMTAILAACSHSGLVDEGRMILNSMKDEYGIEPSTEHYACLVDLLGRCGHIEEAYELIKNSESARGSSVWGALLSASMIHKHPEMAEIAARHLFVLEPRNASNYIALGSVYDFLRIHEGVSRIRATMRESRLIKTPGCSWIVTEGCLHKFYQGNFTHPSGRIIYETLTSLTEAIRPRDFG